MPSTKSKPPQKKPNELGILPSILSLCKRRGFLFPSSEIYGGLNSCWDYGPLGAQLKRNIKDRWWREMTLRPDISGLDSSIFMRPEVWEASGHLEGFTDPLSDCKDCKHRFLGPTQPSAVPVTSKSRTLPGRLRDGTIRVPARGPRRSACGTRISTALAGSSPCPRRCCGRSIR